jgi:plastocyanin
VPLGFGALPCHWGAGAAQAGALDQAGPAGAAQVVRVDLTEWALTPSRVAVAAGRPVRFVATNGGAIPHALVVEGAGVHAETGTIGSAESARLDVTFAAPGLYDLFCPIAVGQHRLLGQDGRVAAVEPAPGAAYPLTDAAADEAILVTLLGPEGAAAASAAANPGPAPESPADVPEAVQAPEGAQTAEATAPEAQRAAQDGDGAGPAPDPTGAAG